MASGDDRTPLLTAEEGGVRQRTTRPEAATQRRWQPPQDSDWDPDLPYGGKVYLARKKKPDPMSVRVAEVRGSYAFCFSRLQSSFDIDPDLDLEI